MSAHTHEESAAEHDAQNRIGLVLAGGGARGAYEAGVLSVLLPALEEAGERISVIVGTSVGAVNGAWVAANLHRPADELVPDHVHLWRALRWQDVISPVWSARSLAPLARHVLAARRVESLLDSAPLLATLKRRIDFDQLQRNVRSGDLHAAAVVATSASTGRSVVFHAGGSRLSSDNWRGIDYAHVRLDAQHVRASAAIPAAFRPVLVTAPASARGWYFDGGTRLNTPIKPALALGARRIIVVGLNATRPAPHSRGDERCPDAFHGIGQLTQAVLADPLAHDVRTLATINASVAGAGEGHHRLVPYVMIAPRWRDAIGRLASDVYVEHYRGYRGLRTSVGLLGRLVHAEAGAPNGELLSYLFFAPEFAEALLAEGANDARRWLRQVHDDGLWQHVPVGAATAREGSPSPAMQ